MNKSKLLLALPIVSLIGLFVVDRIFPPPELARVPVSATVLGRNAELLRAYEVSNGRWRLGVKLAEVDPLLQNMIIAYEDKRFGSHFGVDPLSSLRALKQLVTSGHIVSGGSTLTMQLARLLEPRESRSVFAKFKQVARALQLERRYSKDQILTWYLTLAPYGGNLEGVRAASLSWFGKEPTKLSVAQAALLVALPQSPEGRRPDKFPTRVKAARDRVIERMQSTGVIAPEDATLALQEPLPDFRYQLPTLAAHASDAAHKKGDTQITIDGHIQKDVERVMRDASAKFDSSLSAAVIVADLRTGEVIARAGATKPFDQKSRGWVDMTRAVRSPGSTLKPFIYGLAFENGIAHPETLIDDNAENFRGYRPKNFAQNFHGDVTLRQALQLSLNLPAVKLLDSVGPLRLAATLREAGVAIKLPRHTSPTLAVSLGGVGMTLDDLVTLYSALPRGGVPFVLHDDMRHANATREAENAHQLFGENASWYVSDILSGTEAPAGVSPLALSFKTGTSFGNRDAWAIGFDNKYVTGVWVGRADGTAVSDLTGRTAAAPLLFNVFEILNPEHLTHKSLPPKAIIAGAQNLPQTLKRFGLVPSQAAKRIAALEILFPPTGAKISRQIADDGTIMPLVIKFEGGAAPYRILIDGALVDKRFPTQTAAIDPRKAGYVNLTVVDSNGEASSIGVNLE